MADDVKPVRDKARDRLTTWITYGIMPHEASARQWLRRRLSSRDDTDDLIQEAYARLVGMTAFEHIAEPRRYFHQVVRNLLIDHVRRQRVVRIDAAADIETVEATGADPEQAVAAREEVARVHRAIDALPERCRQVIRLRKIEGLSQREIALRLNVSESIVENDGIKGLRLIAKSMRETPGIRRADDEESRYGRPADR